MKYSTLIIFLTSLWSENVTTHHLLSLRVKPNESDHDVCQHNNSEPCETLSYYATQQDTRLLSETDAISITFLQGRHYPANLSTENIHIRDKESLILHGVGMNTIVIGYRFRLLSINSILITNIKCESSKIVLNAFEFKDRPNFKFSNVTIRNCTFIESALIFKSVLLHIENTIFTKNSQSTALKLYSSHLIFHGRVSFINNSAISGGALSLIESIMYVKGNCSVDFINNSAEETGGAVFIDNDDECFYIVEPDNPRHWSNCTLHFRNNKAKNGGNHIYGTSFMSSCPNYLGKFSSETQTVLKTNWSNLITFEQPGFNNEDSLVSALSSTPSRVCLCSDQGRPACTDIDKIFVKMEVCPGEVIAIPVVLVGAEFGTTTGSIYVNILHDRSSQAHHNVTNNMQVVVYSIKQNEKCTVLKFKIKDLNNYCLVYLSATATDNRYISRSIKSINIYKTEVHKQIVYHETDGIVKDLLQSTPIFVNITVSECPPGFTIYTQNGMGCDCYEPLKNSINNLRCTLEDHRGYMSWNTTAWIGFDENNNLIYSKHCFPYYCRRAYKKIDMGNESMLNTQQCWPNREGVLCSKCTKGHSLAIGSPNCIHCPSSNNLALLLFFAVSGFLLVLFINILNLTVTQGMINGLIFYVNIVWEYQSIASQREVKYTDVFLKPFVAWLNLDFGIETCFVKGLDPYIKTWLQFLFPLYIWTIASLMITAAHYSTRITNIIGSRALHTLCTLLFISYSKLFRIIKDILHLTVLTTITDNNGTVYKDKTIWLWEGNRTLHDSKYLGLFVFAIVIFLILWIPYTMILTCIQPLRRVSHYKCFKWVTKLSPVFDSYLAPLKHHHHYFFGVLLLTRGFLLLIVLAPSRGLNLHNLMVIAILTLILIHMAFIQPYRSKLVLTFQCISFGNLIILVAVISYLKLEDRRYKYWIIATTISVTFAFVQFCIIVVWSCAKLHFNKFKCTCACKICQSHDEGENEPAFDSSIESRRESFSAAYLQEPA